MTHLFVSIVETQEYNFLMAMILKLKQDHILEIYSINELY